MATPTGNASATSPRCIGVIMDGNRRWARAQGLLSVEGHKAGYEKFKEFLRWTKDAGIIHVIAYVFSTENWKRSEEEVGFLMNLLQSGISMGAGDLVKEGAELRFIGERERLSKTLQESMQEAERKTTGGNLKLHLALSYGGRQEILQAVKKVLPGEAEQLTEEQFAGKLFTADVPDPDLIIRTGGEMRLSNFLLWQCAYSELFFTKTLWPAFTHEEFVKILSEFSERERRMGK